MSTPPSLDASDLAALRAEVEQLKVTDPQSFYAPRFTALAVERLLDTIDELAVAPRQTEAQRIFGLLGVA